MQFEFVRIVRQLWWYWCPSVHILFVWQLFFLTFCLWHFFDLFFVITNIVGTFFVIKSCLLHFLFTNEMFAEKSLSARCCFSRVVIFFVCQCLFWFSFCFLFIRRSSNLSCCPVIVVILVPLRAQFLLTNILCWHFVVSHFVYISLASSPCNYV